MSACFVRAMIPVTLFFSACAAPVTPPTDLRDPVTVFVLREALHTGLVLPPIGDGGVWVEFGFGDWSWYACGNDAWYRVFETVLWPTQGAFARRVFRARDDRRLREVASWAELLGVQVERERAVLLRAVLQQAFDAGSEGLVAQPRYRMEFVPDDGGYWWAANCNDRVGEWLELLGCEVGWRPIVTSLSIEPPP
ncbi:MAG: DUF2459 domain-containing protein [Planctomycetes bacterium]|nr:DUF2459 domain-containing protein [Planctomycetota bacterium]